MPQQLINSATLPLAVYRELAAHLRQVEGVKTRLEKPQHQHFDYHLSQLGPLVIDYPCELDDHSLQQLDDILTYYTQRYGNLDRQFLD